MKILITGGNGQLGRDAAEILGEAHEVFALGRADFDITDQAQVQQKIHDLQPDVVLHAAAWTNVDGAESDPDGAFLVNAIGTRNVAAAAEAVGAKLVYISTDYVFAGTGTTPYHEFDATGPQGLYGKSKLAGEELVKSLSSRWFIVRTSWVYGKHGANFVKTMLQLASTRDVLTVVHDQVGSPTYTVDLARWLGHLMETDAYGVYHASNSGYCSWYEFAQAIFRVFGLTHVTVTPCTSEEFKRPAPRPANSRLDHMAIRLNGLPALPPWQDALVRFQQELEGQR